MIRYRKTRKSERIAVKTEMKLKPILQFELTSLSFLNKEE